MCKTPLDLRTFRTLDGSARRAAMRAHLTKAHGVDFSADVHAIPISALAACAELAKAVSWRKSPSSSLSTGAAFFTYLAREARPVSFPQAARKPRVRVSFNFGGAQV